MDASDASEIQRWKGETSGEGGALHEEGMIEWRIFAKMAGERRGMVGNRKEVAGDPEAAAQSGRKITQRRNATRGRRAADRARLPNQGSNRTTRGKSRGRTRGTLAYDASGDLPCSARQPRLFFDPSGRVTAGKAEPSVRFVLAKGSVGCGEPDMWEGVPWGRALSAK
jgi:hypothetical protein